MSKLRGPNDGTNLIVNYLPQTVDESELCKMFGECGVVESVKVIRDGKSQISRGFAFVKYADREAADKAIKKYSGYKMGRKTLRVSLSRPAGEDTRDTNLMIENIPFEMEDEGLYEQFSVYGQIITHRVVRAPDGSSKCKAYVRYNLKGEAEDAITALNGVNIGGKEDLVVRFADPPTVKATPELMTKRRVVSQPYPVPGFRSQPRPPVQPRGAVIRPAKLHPPPRGGGRHMPRDWQDWPAIGTYPASDPYQSKPSWGEEGEGAKKTWSSAAGKGSAGITVIPPVDGGGGGGGAGGGDVGSLPDDIPDKHRSSYDPEKGWVVFVYNLPATANNETLYSLFARFGAINTVKPIVDNNGSCKGYGFVHMPKYEDACHSIQMLDGHEIHGRALQVRFKNSLK